jgi:hypothetical protein
MLNYKKSISKLNLMMLMKISQKLINLNKLININRKKIIIRINTCNKFDFCLIYLTIY